MADRNIDIRIRANSNAAGEIEKTNRSLDKLDKSQGKAAKSAKASKEASVSAGQGFASVGQAASVTGSGVDQLSKRISLLNKVITGFGIVGIIGALTTVIGLLKRLTNFLKEKTTASITAANAEAAALAESLTGERMRLAQQMVNSVADAYDRAAIAINNANSRQKDYLAALQDLNTAQQEATALEMQRQELAALAALKPDDSAGEAAVRARFAKARLANELGLRGSSAIRGAQAAEDELSAASARRAAAASALAKARDTRSTLQDQLEYSKTKAEPKVGLDRWGKLTIQGDANAPKEVEELSQRLSELDSTIEKLADVLAAEQSAEKTAGIRLQAARVRAGPVISAAESLSRQQAAAIDRSQQSTYSTQLEQAQTQQSGISSRLAELRAASVKEQGDVRRALNFGASEEQMRKELEEARKAADAVRQYSAENAATMRELTRTINQAREALRNLPKN